MHISHTTSLNIPVSIALATLAHVINVYEICLNKQTIQYSICKISDIACRPPFGLFWSAGIPTMVTVTEEALHKLVGVVLHHQLYCCKAMLCWMILV